MPARTTLSDALIEAGLEAEAARRWARAIEQEQAAAARQQSLAGAKQQFGFGRWRIDVKRPDRFLPRSFPVLIALLCLEFIGIFTMLGYIIGRLSQG